ncbi:rhodanese-like domain-containing protein [Niveispirillum cyanobacteriorum]|uniref:Sulfurtransferase n=1 Tax=Niveispirillum cyanobacteriorum TaxID=1612173 RepID=A0A2K9N9G1_9PROT|nr:rhodanese-like domain-containing protein [Niveispirillum cyanobacteriorum]AUN29781.1 sulfurtransferase [Niveispirillum cyanobacteriorum]GGE60786.1 rhodanese [Niveispirillum cyanobacteriorum]
MSNEVTRIQAAPSPDAIAHFQKRLSLETDCADVFAAFATGSPGFVLVDVRGRKAFAASHVPGAINIPVMDLTEKRLAAYPADTLFVVYCAGPHCNGADKGALRLAGLGRPVKLMIGGMTGWADEGFSFEGTV